MHHLLAVTQKPFWPTRGKRQSGGLGLGFAGRWAARLLQNLQSTLNGVDDHFLHLQPWRGKNKSVSDCSALTVFHAAGKKMGKCPPVNSELRLRPAVWQLGKRQKVRARASFLDPRSTALYYIHQSIQYVRDTEHGQRQPLSHLHDPTQSIRSFSHDGMSLLCSTAQGLLSLTCGTGPTCKWQRVPLSTVEDWVPPRC
jgi:hypothetical protein